MPSPLVHTATGLFVLWLLRPFPHSRGEKERLPAIAAVLIVTILSLLPDLPSLIGILLNDFSRFHNNWEHSLVAGLAAALLVGGSAVLVGRRSFGRWLALALILYELHVIMDFFTIGRGVKILWPISFQRYTPRIKFFYGLHWSDGWWSVAHLWTLVTELLTIAAVGALIYGFVRRRGLRSGSVATRALIQSPDREESN
jgi:membrane-bound metal-dependent hydrolase YbcI (DUF457 family)